MIRIATLNDVERIAQIYNEAILEGRLTGDLEPLSIEDRREWFLNHKDRYTVLVSAVAGRVVGYAALSPYRYGRPLFADTCELSYYFARSHRGRGLGRDLINYAIEYAANSGFHLIVSLILECNHRSVDILMKNGFSISGRMPKAARIDGARYDHLYLSRLVVPNST
jgi:phosphinothricin acetyltransferase